MKEKMIMDNKAKTFMPLLSGIIIALAVIFLGSGSAWAADVSDQTGLEAALSGSDSVITLTDHITLTGDITVDRAVTLSGGVITLDTAGHSLIVASGGNLIIDGDPDLTITGSGEQTINVQNAGTFTLRSGVISASRTTWHSAIYIDGGGTVNIEGGTVVSDDNNYSEGALYANGGIVTVNVSGGKITGYTCGIKLFHYDSTSSRSTATVSGGTIAAISTSNQTYGMWVEKGNVTIDGDAEFSAQVPVSVVVGSADISSGTFSGGVSFSNCPTVITGGTFGSLSIADTTTVSITGGIILDGVYLENCDTVEISGGTFTSPGDGIYVSGCGDTAISGGTFSGAVGVGIYGVDPGKSVSISGDADITGTTYGVYGESGTFTITDDVTVSGPYGLYLGSGCTAVISGGTITGNSYGSIFINGGALTLTGGTIINSRNETGYYGIYIQTGPADNRITSSEDLIINAYAPLFYKVSSCFNSIPGPQTMAVGETKAVTLQGFDISAFIYTVDTINTSAELNASGTNNFSIAPTTAGNYNLVLSGSKSGESEFLTLTIPVSVVYSVTYDANGGTGAAPAKIYKDEDEPFTTAAAGSFVPPADKRFKEWNTEPNGGGTGYLAGATVTMPANNLMLYAIWQDSTLESIDITTLPNKLVYTVGDSLDITGMVVTGTYSDYSTGALTVTAADVSGFDSSVPAASQTLTVTIGGKTDTYTISINSVPIYGVSLAPPAAVPYFYDAKSYGYGAVSPLTVTVTNSGNQPTGLLNVILGGVHTGSYTLSKTTINSLDPGNSDTFTVAPKTGLTPETYGVTVEVSGNNGILAGIPLMFTVNAATADIASIPGVTAPVSGGTPDTAITETAQYTGTIAWAPSDSPFVQGTVYTAAITLTAKTGYTFNGLNGNFFTVNGADAVTSPVGTDAAITVTAVFPAASAESSGGSGNGSSGGSSTVSNKNLIPMEDLTASGRQDTIIVENDIAKVVVPSNMLTGVAGIGGKNAEIVIGKGDKDKLPDDVKTAIGDKPLISLTLKIDGKQTDWNNPNAPVTISIPYTPTAAELADPESIVIWFIDGSGNAVTIPNGHYDSATGRVTFSTTHFSDYAVAYNPVRFSDMAAGAWYCKPVSFIAARGITGGTGGGNFSPDAKLTRGEFIVLLMRAYAIAPDTNPKDNFSDAGNTYYTGYLAAAKSLGISSGKGSNQYAPGKEISRQEMFSLLYNALKVIGQLPGGDSGKTLSDYTDAEQINAWAKDAMTLMVKTGTVGGNNGKLTPTGTTTRAEMAQVLYNLLGK